MGQHMGIHVAFPIVYIFLLGALVAALLFTIFLNAGIFQVHNIKTKTVVAVRINPHPVHFAEIPALAPLDSVATISPHIRTLTGLIVEAGFTRQVLREWPALRRLHL